MTHGLSPYWSRWIILPARHTDPGGSSRLPDILIQVDHPACQTKARQPPAACRRPQGSCSGNHRPTFTHTKRKKREESSHLRCQEQRAVSRRSPHIVANTPSWICWWATLTRVSLLPLFVGASFADASHGLQPDESGEREETSVNTTLPMEVKVKET